MEQRGRWRRISVEVFLVNPRMSWLPSTHWCRQKIPLKCSSFLTNDVRKFPYIFFWTLISLTASYNKLTDSFVRALLALIIKEEYLRAVLTKVHMLPLNCFSAYISWHLFCSWLVRFYYSALVIPVAGGIMFFWLSVQFLPLGLKVELIIIWCLKVKVIVTS